MEGKKPLTEVLAGIYVNEMSKLKPKTCPPWVNTNEEYRRAHMAAMHAVVQTLDLFGIAVTIDHEGNVTTEKIPKEQPAARKILARGEQSPTDIGPPRMSLVEAKQSGFTGDICSECGSMQMVRNGSCLKCQSCGSTTGCS